MHTHIIDTTVGEEIPSLAWEGPDHGSHHGNVDI
jgi:hypothetical protein